MRLPVSIAAKLRSVKIKLCVPNFPGVPVGCTTVPPVLLSHDFSPEPYPVPQSRFNEFRDFIGLGYWPLADVLNVYHEPPEDFIPTPMHDPPITPGYTFVPSNVFATTITGSPQNQRDFASLIDSLNHKDVPKECVSLPPLVPHIRNSNPQLVNNSLLVDSHPSKEEKSIHRTGKFIKESRSSLKNDWNESYNFALHSKVEIIFNEPHILEESSNDRNLGEDFENKVVDNVVLYETRVVDIQEATDELLAVDISVRNYSTAISTSISVLEVGKVLLLRVELSTQDLGSQRFKSYTTALVIQLLITSVIVDPLVPSVPTNHKPKAIPAAIDFTGMPLYAPPVNFPPIPKGYTSKGDPYYSKSCKIPELPCSAFTIYGEKLFGTKASSESVNNLPMGYTRSGTPFFIPLKCHLPTPTGFTAQGIPYYSAYEIVSLEKFVGISYIVAMNCAIKVPFSDSILDIQDALDFIRNLKYFWKV